jgi:hypothetical protein
MASKTVWIVGGVVVAIGAIAYLSYNKAPAGKDAAGTIVEAKRARTDGTNSFNPTPTASTTEQNASDASKATAGPDAAKDAAGAAGSDNGVKSARGHDDLTRQAADTAAAAEGGMKSANPAMKSGNPAMKSANPAMKSGNPAAND